MKKAVLMSIKPKWCEKIFNGKKFVELRKTKPQLNYPFTVYVYCTKEKLLGEFLLCKSDKIKTLFPTQKVVGVNRGVGTPVDTNLQGYVIGEFMCESVEELDRDEIIYGGYSSSSCVPLNEMLDYLGKSNSIYGWKITNVILYDTPKHMSEFTTIGDCSHKVGRAPQSYMFVNELQ